MPLKQYDLDSQASQNSQSQASTDVPFPAPTRSLSTTIEGRVTEVTCTEFSDRIFLTIGQDGKLGQWIELALRNDDPSSTDPFLPVLSNVEDDTSFLPPARFAPRTLLGGANTQRETVGHLLASQIAGFITTRNPREERLLMLGLGLMNTDVDRDLMIALLDLVTRVL